MPSALFESSRIYIVTFRMFLNPPEPKATSAINPAPKRTSVLGNGTAWSDVSEPLMTRPLAKISCHLLEAKDDTLKWPEDGKDTLLNAAPVGSRKSI